MIRPLLLACMAVAPVLLAASAPATAQPGARQNNNNGTVRCESVNNRPQTCQTGWRGATLSRQLSDTRCVEGQNWGSRNGQVWVSGGCRAEFRAAGNGNGWNNGNNSSNGVVRCESADNRQRVCQTGWRAATLTRQLSKTQCVEGRNWGSRNGQIWVSQGCRAEFVEGRGHGPGNRPGNNYSITCASDDNRTRNCAWERRQGRPVLVEQLSRTQCVEGRNWGYNGNTLWVSQGCRARFGSR